MAQRSVRLPTGQDLVVEDSLVNPEEDWGIEPDPETAAMFPGYGQRVDVELGNAEVEPSVEVELGQGEVTPRYPEVRPIPGGMGMPLGTTERGTTAPGDPAPLPEGTVKDEEEAKRLVGASVGSATAKADRAVEENLRRHGYSRTGEPLNQAGVTVTAAPRARGTGSGSGGSKEDPLKLKEKEIEEKESELFIDSLLLQQQRQDANNELGFEQLANERAQAWKLNQQRILAENQQKEIEQETRRLMQRAADTADEAANKRLDPDKYWSDRSRFARALGSLSMIIGARSSRGNAGKELLDKAIADEIHAQEFNVEQAWRRNEAANNAFGQYLAAYGSPQAARENLRAVLNAQLEHERKVDLLQSGLTRQEAEADETIQALRLNRRNALLEAESATLAAQFAARERAAQAAAAAAAAQAKRNQPDPALAVYSDGVLIGYASNAKHLKAVQDQLSGLGLMGGHIARLEELANNPERLIPGSKTYAEWNARKSAAQIALKDAAKLGQISKHDVKYLSEQIPGPLSLRPQAILQEQRRILEERKRSALSTSVVDPEGNPVSGPLPQGEEEEDE